MMIRYAWLTPLFMTNPLMLVLQAVAKLNVKESRESFLNLQEVGARAVVNVLEFLYHGTFRIPGVVSRTYTPCILEPLLIEMTGATVSFLEIPPTDAFLWYQILFKYADMLMIP